MDLIDLEARALVSKTVEEIAPQCRDFPLNLFIDDEGDGMPWVTFNRLLKHTGVVADLREMLALLAREYGAPVDIEFAVNFLDRETFSIHLLQCRTFQVQKHASPGAIEGPPPPDGTPLLEARGAVIGLGRSILVHDLLYVPTAAYAALPEQDRYQVARLIESLVEKHDPGRNLVLLGPGRWGTGSPSLGVPVRAGRIASACAVCEVVAMHSGLIPDVSLGTHFFNDLVEHDLLYLACFPGKAGNSLDEALLLAAPSRTAELATVSPGAIADCVRWIDLSQTGAILVADAYRQSASIVLPPAGGLLLQT
jgi:hypothetical protein